MPIRALSGVANRFRTYLDPDITDYAAEIRAPELGRNMGWPSSTHSEVTVSVSPAYFYALDPCAHSPRHPAEGGPHVPLDGGTGTISSSS